MNDTKKNTRQALLRILRIVVSVGLLALLYSRMDWTQARSVMGGIRVAWIPVLFLVLLANSLLSAWKWKLILDADGVRLGLWTLLRTYLIGGFMNLFLPSTVGGDAYRIVTLAKHTGGAGRSAASVLADRLTGFIALSVLALVFGGLRAEVLPSRWMILVPLAATGGFVVAGWIALHPALLFRFVPGTGGLMVKVQGFLGKLQGAMQRYRETPGLYVRIFAISFAFQSLVVLFVGLLLRSMGREIEPLSLLAVVPMISLVEAVPLSIFGLGLRDAAYVVFLGPLGVDRPTALIAAAFYVMATVLYVSMGGLLWAFAPERTTRPVP